MKFGETLQQRSIPQWAHYNVDYDELKYLIKERTSAIKTNPVSIPGQGGQDTTWDELEHELFAHLYDQHERVNLFTKSKYGEIERRLASLSRQVKQLGRSATKTTDPRVPVQHSRKFQRLVEEAETIGEDIQSLSRYTNTQRLAFKKILKKYQKWTDSSKLTMRMNNEVFNRPSSFLQPDLTPLLGQLSSLQGVLRHVSIKGVGKSAQTSATVNGTQSNKGLVQQEQEASGSIIISEAFRNGDAIDIDFALSSTPLGQKSGRAVYWIHPDNVAEVRVLILRHMREHAMTARPSLSRVSSVNSIGSRHGSISKELASSSADSTNFVLFDELDAFVQEQNAETLNHTEDTPGSFSSRVLMQAGWNSEAKTALVMVSDATSNDARGSATSHRIGRYQLHRVRSKDLSKIFATETSHSNDELPKGLSEVQSWIAERPKVKPLAHVTSKRSRFEGLDNDNNSGMWATLDQLITMSTADNSFHVADDHMKSTRSDFPHAVLEIRWERDPVPDIVNILNGSYLVERVRGFSLQMHAIYTICSPSKAAKPFWMSVIDKDIRKVPPKQPRISVKRSPEDPRELSKATSGSGPSTDEPSDRGTSSNPIPSSATSVADMAFTNPEAPPQDHMKKDTKGRAHDLIARRTRSPVRRYWNEFDDGSEAEDNDVYTIYVDPNASITFPGYESLSRAASSIKAIARKRSRKVLQLFHYKDSDEDGSRQPLLGAQSDVTSHSADDSTDSEPTSHIWSRRTTNQTKSRASRRAFPSASVRSYPRQSREVGLFRTYVGCFIATLILLFVTSILEGTGRRKLRLEVDVGVIIGVVASLCFGILGLSMMLLRKEPLTWLHRTAVFLAFAIVCIASGILLASVGDAF